MVEGARVLAEDAHAVDAHAVDVHARHRSVSGPTVGVNTPDRDVVGSPLVAR